jgi:hypothetical protein
MTCGFAANECHSNAEISIMSALISWLPLGGWVGAWLDR